MNITIEINLDNDETKEAEREACLPHLVSLYLISLAKKLSRDYAFFKGYTQRIYDGNGNAIGTFTIKE